MHKNRPIAQVASSLLLGTVALLFANRAAAVAPIGDDAELFITGVVQASYNDNIFLSHTHDKADEIYDLTPGLSYEFGKGQAQMTGKLAAYEDFQEFSSGGNLNRSLANVVSNVAYDDSKTKFDFNADLHQVDQAERDISNVDYLVDRTLYDAGGSAEVQATQNSSFGAGVTWDDTVYHHAGYVDFQTTTVPVDYYFKVEPKLDLSVGFRYRDNLLGKGGIGSKDYYYNVGARGEFTPDLTGEIDVGYNTQKMAVGNTSFDGLGVDSRFIYAVSAKSSVDFGLNDDFSYDALGSAYRSVGPFIGFTTALDPQWSVSGRATYGQYSYLTQSRKDNFTTLQAGVSYLVSANVTVTGSYSYYKNSSSIAIFSFGNDVLSISASLHF